MAYCVYIVYLLPCFNCPEQTGAAPPLCRTGQGREAGAWVRAGAESSYGCAARPPAQRGEDSRRPRAQGSVVRGPQCCSLFRGSPTRKEKSRHLTKPLLLTLDANWPVRQHCSVGPVTVRTGVGGDRGAVHSTPARDPRRVALSVS